MSTDILEYVYRDVPGEAPDPGRGYANTIDWELREDGDLIEATVTRVVLVLTPVSGGTAITLDSNDVGFGTGEPFRYDSGTLHMDLSDQDVSPGIYTAALDVFDGSNWYYWGRRQTLRIVVR